MEIELNFLHQEFDLQAGDLVEVTLDAPANVMLLDPENFSNYKRNSAYRYRGGYIQKSPVQITVPHSGIWHVVVNLGGYPGRVVAGARVLRPLEVASIA